MATNREIRKYEGGALCWTGMYQSLQNLPHWHYDGEIIYAEKGGAEVSIAGERTSLSCGQAAFVAPGKMHYIKSPEDSVIIVFLFDKALLEEAVKKTALCSSALANRYDFHSLYENMTDELNLREKFYAEKCALMLKNMLIDIFRTEATTENEQADRRMGAFKQLSDDVLAKYPFYTFEQACSFTGLSAAYFSKKFKQLFGMTFSQFLNAVRTERAIREILSDRGKPITEVSISCGFGTIRNFNRVFRELTGLSPHELPDDFVLLGAPLCSESQGFNPTLSVSKLIK